MDSPGDASSSGDSDPTSGVAGPGSAIGAAGLTGFHRTIRRALRATGLSLALLGLAGCYAASEDRRFDDVSVVGLSPDPAEMREAIVQVFAARSWQRLSRLVSVHTWIAFKAPDAARYTVMETSQWYPYPPALKTCRKRRPDRRWHGATPRLIAEITGAAAERAIPRIRELARDYPAEYDLWPGPNSNTFTAYIIRNTPELKVDLPPTAIGKDYFVAAPPLRRSLSGTGVQVSLNGMLGLTVGLDDGVEVNLFGAVFGVDLMPPALKLPIIGRLGFDDAKRADGIVPFPAECRCGRRGGCWAAG